MKNQNVLRAFNISFQMLTYGRLQFQNNLWIGYEHFTKGDLDLPNVISFQLQ